jgi:hypothetical protein
MAKCRFCHKYCGLFRSEHSQCTEKHRTTVYAVRDLFSRFLSTGATPEDFRRTVLATAVDGYLRDHELREIVIEGVEEMAEITAAGWPTTMVDSERVKQVANAFKLPLDDCGNAKSNLDKCSILRALDEGHLPRVTVVGDIPIHLQNGEAVIWNFSPASCFEIKKHISYVGASRGVSLRVARGVYYRAGSHRGQRVEHEDVTLIASGELAICSKNIYFLSSAKSVRIPLSKIISVNVLSDGIEIFKDSSSGKPQVFKIDDPHFAANVLSRLSDVAH